jgi:hypothetical protein
MTSSRTAAILTWTYAAAFGLPALPVGWYVAERGSLPWFAGMFPMYGGPWWDRFTQRTFLVLLAGFAVVLVLVAGAAWMVWRGRRYGVPVSLGLMVVEAVFWYGFALPVPWVFGAARLALLIAAERRRRTMHAIV